MHSCNQHARTHRQWHNFWTPSLKIGRFTPWIKYSHSVNCWSFAINIYICMTDGCCFLEIRGAFNSIGRSRLSLLWDSLIPSPQKSTVHNKLRVELECMGYYPHTSHAFLIRTEDVRYYLTYVLDDTLSSAIWCGITFRWQFEHFDDILRDCAQVS